MPRKGPGGQERQYRADDDVRVGLAERPGGALPRQRTIGASGPSPAADRATAPAAPCPSRCAHHAPAAPPTTSSRRPPTPCVAPTGESPGRPAQRTEATTLQLDHQPVQRLVAQHIEIDAGERGETIGDLLRGVGGHHATHLIERLFGRQVESPVISTQAHRHLVGQQPSGAGEADALAGRRLDQAGRGPRARARRQARRPWCAVPAADPRSAGSRRRAPRRRPRSAHRDRRARCTAPACARSTIAVRREWLCAAQPKPR